MKYEINGKVVETDKELSEAEIDEIAGQIGGGQTATTPMSSSEPINTAPSALDTVKNVAGRLVQPLIGDPSKFGQPIQTTSTNPAGRLLQALQQSVNLTGPSRLSASLSQPGQIAGQAVERSIGPDRPILGKTANFLTAMALDPQTYISGQGIAKGAVNLGTKALKKVGQESAALGSAVSGVKLRDIKTLFDNPTDVITALSTKEAGGKLGVAKKAAGVTREDEFLISKAGDRSTGGARTVGEQLRPRFDLSTIPETKMPSLQELRQGSPRAIFIGNQEFPGQKPVGLYNIVGDHPSAGSTVSLAALQKEGIPVIGKTVKAVPAEGTLSVGELVALNRAAGKLGAEAKGSEKALWAPIAAQAKEQLHTRAKAVAEAIDLYAKAATKENFTRLVPRGATGKPDFFRTVGAIGTGLVTSPAAVGIATLGVKAGTAAMKPLLQAATSRPVRAVTSSSIRQYLLRQLQNGPGSR